MAYPLGWSIITRLDVKRERWPGGSTVAGVPLVYPGQEVVPDQPVLRLRYLELPEQDLAKQKEHAAVFSSSPSLPVFPTRVPDGRSGYSEDVPAGLHGRVVGFTQRGGVIIESRAAFVQGLVGAGHQVVGVLTLWDSERFVQPAKDIPSGAILVVPGQLTFTMLRQAVISGMVGIVAGSILLCDLEGFLRTDYLQLLHVEDVVQAHAFHPPLTILLTEGIGTREMPAQTLELLQQYQGSVALLTGVTSLRYGLYPELIISLPFVEAQHNWRSVQPDPTLALGTQVRVCSGEFEGITGIIDYFFVYEQVYHSGIRARSARIRVEDGSTYVVPLMMLERIW